MTRDDVIRAFHEAMSHEFDDIPTDLPEHTFSPSFERRMDKLLNSLKKHGRAPLRTAQKIAVIIAASFIIYFTAVTQVEAIREPFLKLVMNTFDTYIDIDFSGISPSFIINEYELTYIPDEFILVDYRSSSHTVYYKYEDKLQRSIIFDQQIVTQNTCLSIDNEQGELSTIYLSDIEILIYKSDFCTSAYWTQDGYYMNLTCIGDFDDATIISMIESVKAVDATADATSSSTE